MSGNVTDRSYNEEIEEVKQILDNMVQSVVDYCMKSGKITAAEKRIIKAMKEATKDLKDDIIKLYSKEADAVDDLTLLDVVNKNRAKILNDIYQAAITPKRKLLSKEAQEVINMVANDLLGHG
ncbi:MAG: hypothetical protein ACTSQE_11345 [Candidatus Heimdallarchaeaceae archaeon]